MIIDYTNLETNYEEIMKVLTDLKSESKTYDEFEYRIKDDYQDGLIIRLWKIVASQYNKEYISQIPTEDKISWVGFIDYIIENSSFLNKNIKTKCRKHFDRLAFYNVC